MFKAILRIIEILLTSEEACMGHPMHGKYESRSGHINRKLLELNEEYPLFEGIREVDMN